MADAADIAGDYTERWLDDALAAAVPKAASVALSRFFCIDCDDPIPLGRREAVPGCVRCTDCEEVMTGGLRRG